MSLPCIQSIPWKAFYDQDISLNLWREDLNHPLISGNKLYKLRPNLKKALLQGYTQVLSFGGSWSNHLHALAWACREYGLESVGVVRGEVGPVLTPTLEDCKMWGMQLVPCDRQTYRRKEDSDFQDQLIKQYPNALIIPEGGSNLDSINALSELWQVIKEKAGSFDWIFCATGTGSTLAGLQSAADYPCRLVGVQAVAEGEATLERIRGWINGRAKHLEVWQDAHLGGFAKITPELSDLIYQIEHRYGIPLDPVYNGKTLLAIYRALEQGRFKSGDRVLMIHTGGLQGIRGLTNSMKVARQKITSPINWNFD